MTNAVKVRSADAWILSGIAAILFGLVFEIRAEATDIFGYREYYYGFTFLWWYDDSASSLDREIYVLPLIIHFVYLLFLLIIIKLTIQQLWRFSFNQRTRYALVFVLSICLIPYVYSFVVCNRYHAGFVKIDINQYDKVRYSVKIGLLVEKEAWVR